MKEIPGYEPYKISIDDGMIYNPKGMMMKYYINDGGYKTVTLNGYGIKSKHLLLHRALMLAYRENPLNKPFCNHIDGNKLNNSLSNLEWCTAKENRIHAVSTGLITNTTKGRRPHSKLDPIQVATIRMCLAQWTLSKTPCKDLAKYFNVSPTLISAIKRRVAWASN